MGFLSSMHSAYLGPVALAVHDNPAERSAYSYSSTAAGTFTISASGDSTTVSLP
jgi:hypothetical protein